MIQNFIISSILLFLVGCGADSDLLRDQNSGDASTVPTGSAYLALKNGIYTYKKVDNNYLGFDYFTLEEGCSTLKCSLAHQQYIIFDGNITQKSPSTMIQLSKNGWYEKSQLHECSITFHGQSIRQTCPDGKDETILFSQKVIDSKKLVDYDTQTINSDDLKDNRAVFNSSAFSYDLNTTNQKLYELTANDSSKCYDSKNNLTTLTSSNLSSFTTIFCTTNSFEFTLTDLSGTSGSLSIHNKITNLEHSATWQKKKVFNNYDLIELDASTLENSIFVVHYNGYVRSGITVDKEAHTRALNKDGFNAIYTQLADKYSTMSLTKKHLTNSLYRLGWVDNKLAYNKKSLIGSDTISNEYNGFFSGISSANWVLSTDGFRRESETCPINVFFNSYDYNCEDGRKGDGVHVETKELNEKLAYHYLQKNTKNYKLDNNDTFFSTGAQEIIYRYTSDIDTFIFNPQSSLAVGLEPVKDGIDKLIGADFFISAKDKKHYLKIVNAVGDINGTAKIYALKSNIELNTTTENNSTYILANIEEIASSTWDTQNIDTQTIMQIVLNDEQKEFFNISTKMVLTTFELSSTKVITGEVYQEANKSHEISYLNFEGFTNIESLLVE
jgi:hypothetical protein